MAVTDQKLLPTSQVAVQTVDVALDPVVATSQTDRIIRVLAPGHQFLLLACEVFARVVAAVISFKVVVIDGDGVILGDPTLAINATPEKFQSAAFQYVIGAGTYAKGSTAGAGVAFSAAHVVSAGKFGVVLVQINAAGTISTKVPAATQAYDTAGEAVTNLPEADAANLAIGYLVIEALVGSAWTANTSDLTPASDVEAVTYVDTATRTAAITALVPVAGQSTWSPTPAWNNAFGSLPSTAKIILAYTTDGAGDVTDGFFRLRYRPVPLNGESA